MNLVILGPPGSGKGQNTGKIAKKYNLKHIVVGDIVKAEIRNKTEVGKIMYEYTSIGRFVPSAIIMNVLSGQLKDVSGFDGFIIDTAPINMDQYRDMDTRNIDAAISLQVDNYDVLRFRTLNRLICPKCRNVSSRLEAPTGACPVCDSELEHRYDDNIKTVNFRIEQYKRETVPVINEFARLDKLIVINAELSKEQVFNQICKGIDDFFQKKYLKNKESMV